jgi:hypothetical protein
MEDAWDTDADIELRVTHPGADCGEGGDEALDLSTPSTSDHEIDVVHLSAADGCCPEYLDVTATLDEDGGLIAATYTLGPDPCECICSLDFSYTLHEVPSGTWTVQSGSQSGSIVVD